MPPCDGSSSSLVGAGFYGSYTIRPMEIMGVDIRTIISDNIAKRCAGCGEVSRHPVASEHP